MRAYRVRKVCPHCGSPTISWRSRKLEYVCNKCGWKGIKPDTREVPCISKHDTSLRLARLQKLHKEHPEWGRQDLLKHESRHMVRLYLAGAC